MVPISEVFALIFVIVLPLFVVFYSFGYAKGRLSEKEYRNDKSSTAKKEIDADENTDWD